MRSLWLGPLVAVAGVARADGQCHVLDLQFTPGAKLQIVGWIEDAAGAYVDTIYITQQVGQFGLGNRPGRFDFNSGPKWPYGRRLTVFPVWSHRHGHTFSQVLYQNLQDFDLSHPFSQSSQEHHFCRPIMDTEPAWDTGTCASTVFTDKGSFTTASQQACGTCSDDASVICYHDADCQLYSPNATCSINMTADGGTCTHHTDCCSGYCDGGTCSGASRYPPRTDLTRVAGADSPSVAMYAGLAPWDAVTQATPAMGAAQDIVWAIPTRLAAGRYIAWVEVGKEFDTNATYNATSYPSPPNVPWSGYGEAYRGQPSIVYRVPFTIGTTESIATTASYVGYGDPDGIDGNLRAPDATITTDTPGSGGSRLLLVSNGGAMYRVRIDAHPEVSSRPPDAPSELAAQTITNQSISVAFVAPGATSSVVRGYDVRIRAGEPIGDANFDASTPIAATVVPGAPGAQITFDVTGLLPSTDYYIGVRAYDACKNASPIAVLAVRTADPRVGEVSACFVATAAYGTTMANEVELLRHYRDAILRSTVIGELAIETYYTFGPPVAGVVGESDLLRQAARDLLAPLVGAVRGMAW
jgi:hypothetical protein